MTHKPTSDMDLNKELGVKGFCFRHFKDNAAVARMVREIGLDRIDLSRAQCEFTDPEQHGPAIAAFEAAGVEIVGIGVVTVTGDEARDRPLFDFCRKAGCSTIAVGFAPAGHADTLKTLARLGDEYGVRCAIHNHGGKHWLGSSEILRYVLSLAGEGAPIGVCIDTAWAIQAGEDPVRWLEVFGDRVFGVHYKDFLFDEHGKHRDVIVGEGALDLPAFVRGLRHIGFEGPAVIEYEADPEDPVPALERCVRSMRGVLSSAAAA